ncbi:MAG: YqaE/Pmp3 family membrane protein [Bacteroidia bacterium]
MKKTISTLSVIFLAVLFFSSCSNGRNLTIEKRHYGKGYYVHANGKRVLTNDTKTADVAAIDQTQVADAVSAPLAPEPVVAKVDVLPLNTIAVPVEKSAATSKNVVAEQVVAEPNRTIKKNTIAEQNKEIRHAGKKAKSATDDVSLVLIIVLCFLLPPLAVFFSEGITTNFWIDVILTLLFFLPGIIFALIVCLS